MCLHTLPKGIQFGSLIACLKVLVTVSLSRPLAHLLILLTLNSVNALVLPHSPQPNLSLCSENILIAATAIKLGLSVLLTLEESSYVEYHESGSFFVCFLNYYYCQNK